MALFHVIFRQGGIGTTQPPVLEYGLIYLVI